MDAKTFNAHVRQREREYANKHGPLRAHLTAMIVLGYSYVLVFLGIAVIATLLLLLAILSGNGALAAIKIIWLPAALSVLIIRALWIPAEAPVGEWVHPNRVPRLMARIDEVRAALKAPQVTQILLVPQFNASVTQLQMFGIFGMPRNFLLLGVPLMEALTPEQFDAVLAHEFAHLSGSHPKRGLQAYRIARTWRVLLARLEEADTWASVLFERFFKWYVPRLEALAFVSARADEFAADADASRVTSPRAMGSALAALASRASVGEHYYFPNVTARADHEAEPPSRPWREMRHALDDPRWEKARESALEVAVRRKATTADTHPSLVDRLRALQQLDPTLTDVAELRAALQRLVEPVHESAADRYLGPVGEEYLAKLDAEWVAAMQPHWAKLREERAKMRTEMDALAARDAAGETLSEEELYQYIERSLHLNGIRKSFPLLERAIAANPRDAQSRFIVGSALIEDGRPEGEALLREVMRLDPAAAPRVWPLIREAAALRGEDEGVDEADRGLEIQARKMEAQRTEVMVMREDHVLTAPEPTPEERAGLIALVRAVDGAKRAALLRRELKTIEGATSAVIVVEPTFRIIGALDSRLGRIANEAIQHTEWVTDAYVNVRCVASRSDWIWKRADRLRATFYDAKGDASKA